MARGRRLLPMRTCALLGLGLLAAQLYLALRFVSLEAGAPQGKGLQPPDEEEPGSVRRSDARVDSKVVPSAAAELWKAAGCEVSSRDALSALQRAASSKCRAKIAATACAAQGGTLHPPRLSSSCPRDSVGRAALGCFRDRADFRLLPGYYADYKETNEPDFCVDMCLQSGFPYAGVQYSTECFCGENPPPSASKVADTSCNMKCPGDSRQLCGGYFMMNVYQTGAVKFNAQIAATATDSDTVPVRIVFLLTLNGRASRQVRRLMNALYDKKHYFYIHIDARQDYLYRELLSLENEHHNVRLMRNRFATIWGGASLLEMLLAAMKELLVSDWKWNFVINLSESDFPVKSVEKLEEFLTANKGRNFVKSHGREVQRFIQKQGLDKTFVECDAHMWRVGDRKLPWGLQIDGGSDWIALDRKFVSYVASKEKDDLVDGLLGVFKYTLLPAESFFHTVLRNSEFCDTYVDNNLHITNWKRKMGCKCQYKHVVDWCGCSPNDFRLEDWPRLQASEQRQLFFARKFEPIVNQAIILRVEQWIKGLDQEQVINVDAYWQNIYHYADRSPKADDSLLTVVSSIIRRNSKMLFDEGCLIKPGIINEVTSYHYTDTYKGSLIMHEARMNNFGSVVIETWFKYQHFLQVNRSAKLYERLRILAVSTEYDQKEQVFRNLIRSIGPYSEPSLMYHFIPTLEETITASNVTFLWLDPIGDIAEVSEAIIFEGNVVNFIKPAFKVPLLPGVWTVKLLEGKILVAVTKFLVAPLQFYNSSKISKKEAKAAHGNFATAYKDFTSQELLFKSFLLPNKDKLAAKSKSELNSVRFGSDLKEWIDSLILQFYSVLGTCVSSKDVKSVQCGKITLMPCHMTTWSSLAPDPKSFEGKMKKFAMKNNFSINGV